MARAFILSFKGIAIIALIGLAVRFIVAPFTSWTYDVYPYYSAMSDSLSGLGIYGHVMYSYPPLFMVISYPFVFLTSLFQDPSSFVVFQPSMVGAAQTTGILVPYVTSPAFNLAFKAPLILGDLLVGLLIYRIIRDLYSEAWAKRAFVFWFLNPLVILTGSMMGQFDVLPALMTLVALYFAMKQRYLLVGFALGLGTLLKVYPVFFIFFYGAVIIVKNRKSAIPWISKNGGRQITELVAGGVISLVAVLPFFVTSGGFMDVILRRTDYQQFGGISIWSIWNIFIPNTSPDTAFPELHLTTLIYLVILGASVFWAVWAVKGRAETDINKRLIKGNLLLAASLLILQPLSNPQHLIWLIPFLVLLIPEGARMELRLMALSIAGVLFLISLLSFYALLYPLASYTGLVGVSTLNSSIVMYFNSTYPLHHNYVLGTVIISATLLLYSIFLPSKYDPLTYLRRTNSEVKGN